MSDARTDAEVPLTSERAPAPAGATVLLTDHPWPDVDVERNVVEGAGYRLAVGPVDAPPPAEVEAMVHQYDPAAILTCWAIVSPDAIARPTDLRIVARMGVGLDNIALADATRRGAWVTNVPDYCVGEVSDHAIAMILGMFRGVVRLDSVTKKDGWRPEATGLERVSDLTVGIIGYGRIGRETARKLAAFGCTILASDPSYAETDGIAAMADIARIQAEADVIVLHAQLLPSTHHLVDASFLAACRQRPLIVNVSRGGLIDNQALLAALEAGRLRGAALDVIDGEPDPPAALFGRRDVIATPHIAFASTASMIELRRRACEEVVRVLKGEAPHHPCNKPAPVGAPLPGGVASDIRVVDGPDGPQVVKRALAKLRVSADWFSDPARSSVEVAAIHAFADLIGPAAVPQILWTQPDQNLFAMRLVDPRLRNWKADLLAGHVDLATARQAGLLIGRAHRGSAGRDDLRQTFDDVRHFRELRIDPFFLKVAERQLALAAPIETVVQALLEDRSALVHGDFSPKNILADGADMVLLDFEVAHWGNPRFDLGFCLSHLMLKSFRRGADQRAFHAAIGAVLEGYGQEALDIDDTDLVRITGGLILARFDGSSPVDYVQDIDAAAARALAIDMLTRPEPSLRAYRSAMLEPHP